MGRLRKISVNLTSAVSKAFSWTQLPISGEKNVLFLLVYEGHLSYGVSSTALKEKKKRNQGTFLASALFKVPLAHYNQYVKVSIFFYPLVASIRY